MWTWYHRTRCCSQSAFRCSNQKSFGKKYLIIMFLHGINVWPFLRTVFSKLIVILGSWVSDQDIELSKHLVTYHTLAGKECAKGQEVSALETEPFKNEGIKFLSKCWQKFRVKYSKNYAPPIQVSPVLAHLYLTWGHVRTRMRFSFSTTYFCSSGREVGYTLPPDTLTSRIC